jgi:hypothetical protein
LGARSKTAHREGGANRFNLTPVTPGKLPKQTIKAMLLFALARSLRAKFSLTML